MTHREDNALLDAAQAQAQSNEGTHLAIQLAAAFIAGAGTVAACVLVLSLQVPM